MTKTTKKRRPKIIHSPAPWVAKDGHIFAANDEEVGVIYRTEAWSSGDRVEHEDQANLCLITAAPDLLAALEAVVAVADRKTDEFDQARAAIAKAKGAKSHG